MPKVSKPPARVKRSKPEVQKEFEEIREEVEQDRDTSDAKTAETARIREAEVRQAVDGVTVETVVQRMSGLGLEVARSLSGLSTRLTDEVQLLASLREAVA